MSNVNLDGPFYCGQCGWRLPADKICRNQACPMYGQSLTVLVPPRELISPAVYLQSYRRYILALAVLVLLIGSALFIGIQIGKGTLQPRASNTSSNTNNTSGTLPANKATSTVPSSTQTPSSSPVPTNSSTTPPTKRENRTFPLAAGSDGF